MLHVLWTKFSCFPSTIGFRWLEWFLNQKCLQNKLFCIKKCNEAKKVLKGTFWETPENTNSSISSNLYWAKIWCISLEQQSQGPWISLTSSIELKSSFPFDASDRQYKCIIDIEKEKNYTSLNILILLLLFPKHSTHEALPSTAVPICQHLVKHDNFKPHCTIAPNFYFIFLNEKAINFL